eukprot:g47114.t1
MKKVLSDHNKTLIRWAKEWQVEFNVDKCEVLHFGKFWSHCYRKDVVKLERVQKRFKRVLPGLEDLSYRERLNRLGLFSLEHR